MDQAARRIIERFALKPHPEGGYFREIYRSPLAVRHPRIEPAGHAERSAATQIYFLLVAGQFSAFHRVRPSDEIWHLYAGGPLELHTIDASDHYSLTVLTTDPERGEPTLLVPADVWQAARLAPHCAWAFGGCTVAPGFDFADFEMPSSAELLERHARHERIIRELTRH
jgi:predicted cupin superfamily sugar epimerase